MMIVTLMTSILGAFIATLVICLIRGRNRAEKYASEIIAMQSEMLNYKSHRPFSVSDYLGRIEKQHLKIEQDKEAQKDECIVLWLGLYGLRLNKDGTLEWIDRREKEHTHTDYSLLQNCCCDNTMSCNTAQMEYKINALQCQIAKTEQNAYLLSLLNQGNSIVTTQIPIPDYRTYFQDTTTYRNLDGTIVKGE